MTDKQDIDEGSIYWKKTEGKLYVTTKGNNLDPPSEPWIELTTKSKTDVVKKLKEQIVGKEIITDGDGDGDGEGEGEGDTWRESQGGGKKSKKRRNKNKRHTRKNKK